MDGASHSAAHDAEAALVVDRSVAEVLAPWRRRSARKSLDAASDTDITCWAWQKDETHQINVEIFLGGD